MIKTARLCLRVWKEDDISSFISLCRSDGFNDFSGGRYADMTPEKARAFIRNEHDQFQEDRTGRFGVFLKDTQTPIGVCGLFRMDEPFQKDYEIGYRFPEQYRGKGYAREAVEGLLKYCLDELSLREVFAVVNLENAQSQKLLQSVGMRRLADFTYRKKTYQKWVAMRV